MKIKIIKGIGGKAFPDDFNWLCPVCKNELRSYEFDCCYCKYEKEKEEGVK